MSLALHTHGQVEGVQTVGLYKVLVRAEAEASRFDPADVLLWNDAGAGFAGSITVDAVAGVGVRISNCRDSRVIQPGDVVRVRPGSGMVSVLFRRGSRANTLFTTEQCNSRCLMCSQPPRDEDDRWRVAELLQLIRLVDAEDPLLGVSGGEPTLLGGDLGRLIDACASNLPATQLQILSNGRRFADAGLAETLATRHREKVVWAVPLYGDVRSIHDAVVDAPGAFEETLQGLFELGRLGARIEIRVVLHRMTVDRLPELASFIYRRLPFVEHVALMGLEPMGFAKANREKLWIDPVDYVDQLGQAVFHLHHRGLPVSIYNLPLCVLPEPLWPFARQSISDWKNAFVPECEGCEMRGDCSGFFQSAGPAWRSRAIRPLKVLETAA